MSRKIAVRTSAEHILKRMQNITEGGEHLGPIKSRLLKTKRDDVDRQEKKSNHSPILLTPSQDEINLTQIINRCDESTVERFSVEHWRLLKEELDNMNCKQIRYERLFNQIIWEEENKLQFDYPGGGEGYRARCRLLSKFELCLREFNQWAADAYPKVHIRNEWPRAILDAISYQNIDSLWRK
ncbi:hypothetical protein HELRODRAFT_163546 [Helobdella robusta]|uniref:Uncharacterized protein n=1 Tax=Helobdella robusta TaxID=6412 RepID=T1EU67_HELRO|nr:hypothetical protein HELRODRAFT_163546 [Helobdella robusta]ESN96479.1 hypothetical protein HELRODRAFT_163546 [Helobdella robusta]